MSTIRLESGAVSVGDAGGREFLRGAARREDCALVSVCVLTAPGRGACSQSREPHILLVAGTSRTRSACLEIAMSNLDFQLRAGAESGDVEAVNALIEAGADPSAENFAGNTPLHYAAYSGHTEVIEALLCAGADPSAKNIYDATPLDIAMREERDETAEALRQRECALPQSA